MSRACLAALTVCVWLAGGAAVARAQNAAALPRRFELSGGAGWSGTTSFGDQRATLTPVAGARFPLFTTSSDLASAPAIEAGFAVAVSPALSVNALARYGRSTLRTRVRGDAEGAADVTAEERIRQFTIASGLRWRLTRRRFAGGTPFAAGGFGYLRELHEGDTLAVNGQTFYAGGGLDFPLRSEAGRVIAGIRVEGRALFRTRGVAFDDGLHVAPAAAAAVFFRF